jgi:hypothetical protein
MMPFSRVASRFQWGAPPAELNSVPPKRIAKRNSGSAEHRLIPARAHDDGSPFFVSRPIRHQREASSAAIGMM